MHAHADSYFSLGNSKRSTLPAVGRNGLIPPNNVWAQDSILLKWDESATEFRAAPCDMCFKIDRRDYTYVGNSF